MNAPEVGKLAPPGSGRDAIHMAIAPVVAGERLEPGEHIKPAESGKFYRYLPGEPGGGPLGIVDPFLTSPVEPGQRFWLFLYPGTITSLRHVWIHPAFAPKAPGGRADG